jgi:hypothetical protein
MQNTSFKIQYKQAKLFSQDTVQPNCLYQCSFRVPVQKYRYLVRGSGTKIQNYWRSRILWFIRTLAKVFIQYTVQPNCPNQCYSRIPVQNNRYSVRGSGSKNAKLFMFKDLHFIRLRTHVKHFIQDTVQASKTLQSRYSTTELSLSVFFLGTGTEIPVLGTRIWPKNSKLLTFKNFMIHQNPSKSLLSRYSTPELS